MGVNALDAKFEREDNLGLSPRRSNIGEAMGKGRGRDGAKHSLLDGLHSVMNGAASADLLQRLQIWAQHSRVNTTAELPRTIKQAAAAADDALTTQTTPDVKDAKQCPKYDLGFQDAKLDRVFAFLI